MSNAIYSRMKALLKKLDMIIELLLKDREGRQKEAEARAEEKKEKERAENERLLVDYANHKGKKIPTGGIWSSRNASDTLVHSDGDLIPFGLSEAEKKLMDEFYNH